MYLTGIRLLSRIQGLLAGEDDDLTIELFICLASFTDQRDSWTSKEAFNEAKLLLDQYFKVMKDRPKDFSSLTSRILEEKIKPLFAKSRSKEITEQGRKAISSLPGPFVPSDLEAMKKPWKFRDVYVVTVFRLVLGQLDVQTKTESYLLKYPN